MPLLPHVIPDMLDAAYWLARVPAPDAPILNSDSIRAFNTRAMETLHLPNPLDLPDVLLAHAVRGYITPIDEQEVYYDVIGAPYSATSWEAIRANMAPDSIPAETRVQWGLVTQRTSVRYYPTQALGMRWPTDFFFDRFQGTTVDVGWPVAVVHTSADGQWYFVLTSIYAGWIPAAHVALANSRATVRSFVDAAPFLVAVGSQASVAMADGCHAVAQMGTRLPVAGDDAGARRVLIPRRTAEGRLTLVEGYVAHDDPAWHAGYMPCTLRTVFTRAFALLGEPYAWGGMRAGQFGRDCSGLVRDVWAATGVQMPRNSRQQGKVGVTALRFAPDDPTHARAAALVAHAPPGALLLLPGHVMLYLGAVDGVPYAIHSLWNYNHPTGEVTVAASVVVSDLPAEPSEARHTLTERLTHIQTIGL